MSRQLSIVLSIVLFALGMMFSGLQGYALAQTPAAPVKEVLEEDENSITFSFDIYSGRISVSLGLPANFWQRVFSTEPITPNITHLVRRNPACPAEARTAEGSEQGTNPREAQARTLFQIGERCLENGDFDKARTCFEETHLLAPESDCGRQAIERLSDIDNARTSDTGAAEEQDRGARTSGRRRN